MVATAYRPRGPQPSVRVGPIHATLLNGVFGDPMLHMRIAQHKRSVLVDVGEGARLPARTAHQVTDVFLSHAHIDHIAGFMPFLRSRIGEWPTCRVFGPPGIAANIAGFIKAVHWDRVGHRAPRFAVTEYDGAGLRRFVVEAGIPDCTALGASDAPGGRLFSDRILDVEGVVLDHLTPVLAFAFRTNATVHVRKERLLELGLEPGPWLTQLKDCIGAGDEETLIDMPGGGQRRAGELAADLLIVAPGKKLVYATDLADTVSNRAALEAFAAGADVMFCEAAFCRDEVEQARRTGHLSTIACGEIAAAAGVAQLIPFHFSRRYESSPERVYDELRSVCPATVVPANRRNEQ